jgi:hypothetical protein
MTWSSTTRTNKTKPPPPNEQNKRTKHTKKRNKHAPRDARLGRLDEHAHGEHGDDVRRGAEAHGEAGKDLGGGLAEGSMVGGRTENVWLRFMNIACGCMNMMPTQPTIHCMSVSGIAYTGAEARTSGGACNKHMNVVSGFGLGGMEGRCVPRRRRRRS